MTHNLSVNFKIIPFLLWTKGPTKVPILTLSSAQVKISQIPYVNFETTSQFSIFQTTSQLKVMLHKFVNVLGERM